jgi:hypothetical protein
MNIPVPSDWDFWGHSVCAVRAVWVDGEAVPRIINSWRGWGDDGFATMQGRYKVPNSAVATRMVVTS